MRWLGLSLLLVAAPAAAEVRHSSPNSFEIEHSVQLTAPPARAWAAFAGIGRWWDDAHTYSGKAANMRLGLSPGGCFCEAIPASGGGVEHMRVAFVDPGKRLVMTGGLGPLLYDAVAGVMDVKFEAVAGGSRVVMNYRAVGFHKADAVAKAKLVDQVLGTQMQRFGRFAEAARR